MPLMKSKSKKALGENIESEMEAGKPKAQSLAIALNVQRKAKGKKKMASGGEVPPGHEVEEVGGPGREMSKLRKDNDPKLMAQGGMMEEDEKEGRSPASMPKSQKMKFKDSEGMSMGVEDMRDEDEKGMPGGNYAEGGEVEEHYSSIADAILAKKRKMQEGAVDINENAEEMPNQYDELNMEAAGKELYDDDQLSDQPMDSNEHGDDIDSDDHDMISQIRKKMKSKRDM